MKEKYNTGLTKYLVVTGDIVLLYLAYILSGYLLDSFNLAYEYHLEYFIIFTLAWIISELLNKIHLINRLSSVREISFSLLNVMIMHAFIMFVIIIPMQPQLVSINYLSANYIVLVSLMILSRLSLKLIFKYIEFAAYDNRKVIVVGTTKEGQHLRTFFERHKGAGYQFLGFFDDLDRTSVGEVNLRGPLHEIQQFCIDEDVEEVYFTLPFEYDYLLTDIRDFCDKNTIYFRLVPDLSDIIKSNYHVSLYDSQPVITMRNEPLGVSLNLILKRAFDIVFSLSVILFIFPFIFPFIILAIKLESPGPVFFKQLRPGKRNRLFECYKFRTMRLNDQTELQATKNDVRITRIGSILRKTNLDELPQFFNVLLGSMSVVGPRPNMVSQLHHYSKIIDQYKVRHFITPGITGYAQVNGLRGETQDDELMEKRVEYDVKYIENWSFFLDLKIIFLTVYNMFKGEENAY